MAARSASKGQRAIAKSSLASASGWYARYTCLSIV